MRGEVNRRAFGRLAALVAVAGVAGRARAAAEGAPSPDPRLDIHPELRETVAEFEAMQATAPKDPAVAKKLAAIFSPEPLAGVSWSERTTAGLAGAPDVRFYVINARAGAARPAILHVHGGGFVFGRARDSIAPMQAFARELDCVVVTVDYRIAPGTTWKGSVEDNYAGLRWLHDNAASIGADRSRIAVMGESAGGGHAALLAIAARDRGEVPVMFQSLTYPMLDDRTGSTRMPPPHIGRLAWTAESNRAGWKAFLGMEPGGPDVPPAAVPARNGDLAGLPPAWIGVGAIDLFVDEDVDYAKRLIDSRVPTELDVVPGCFHGFDMLPDLVGTRVPVSEAFKRARLDALRRAFGRRTV